MRSALYAELIIGRAFARPVGYRAPYGPASPRAQAKSFDPHCDKTTRRANQQNLSSPSRENISLSPSGKSLI
jgi:hypothetical protein